MLTIQSSKSQIVCLLIFKVNQDSLGDFILLQLWAPEGGRVSELYPYAIKVVPKPVLSHKSTNVTTLQGAVARNDTAASLLSFLNKYWYFVARSFDIQSKTVGPIPALGCSQYSIN